MTQKPLSLTIDGQKVNFTKGMTILEVAETADVYIPTLCNVEGLKSYGGCRMCIVKVKGARKPIQTACSSPAVADMEIITNDEEIQQMRREILQLRLSEHPNNCLICGHKEVCDDYNADYENRPTKNVCGCFACSKKMECEFKEVVEYLGIEEYSYDFNYRNYPLIQDEPFFERNYNLCIKCGRCVRVCSEIRGVNAIDFMDRGYEAYISTANDISLVNSSCMFCGACVDICPTGALAPKNTKWVENRGEFIDSICNLCPIGCCFHYYIQDGKIIDTIPSEECKINYGQGCVLGRFCNIQLFNSENRILNPVYTRDSRKVPIDWENVFIKIGDILKNYKGDEIAFIASPDLSNESAFVFMKMAKDVFKSNNLAMIQSDSFTKNNELLNKLDLIDAIDINENIILLNANPQITHPVLLVHLKKAYDKGKKIILLREKNFKVQKETLALVTEDINIAEFGLSTLLEKFSEKKSVILVGNSLTNQQINTINAIQEEKDTITLIPLRNRSNINGVERFCTDSFDNIKNKIQHGTIKVVYTTERIPLEVIQSLDCLIIQDIFKSKCSEKANVVLPACSYLESNGTITNIELKEKTFNKIVSSPNNIPSDWEIFKVLVQKISKAHMKDFTYESVDEIRTDMNKWLEKNLNNQKSHIINKELDLKDVKLKDFCFRGEYISEQVPDFKIIAEQRKDDKQKSSCAYTEIETRTNKEHPAASLKITLKKSGELVFSNNKYGLDALYPILRCINCMENEIDLIIDAENDDFIYINKDDFCLCHNYKHVLNESKAIVDLTLQPCNVYNEYRDHDTNKITYEYLERPVLITRDFIKKTQGNIRQTVSNSILCEKIQDLGMLEVAIISSTFGYRSIFKSKYEDIIRELPDELKSNIIWDIWNFMKNDNRLGKADGVEYNKKPCESIEKTIVIDENRCIGCGSCARACPHEAIDLEYYRNEGFFDRELSRLAVINCERCFKCATCIPACPVGAISMRQWYHVFENAEL
ncbi:MAG: molybdopterin-dependent oxidoreductase [Candidatus Lokiarchaeota archaeon]|nr:molybdopterin-dependent oxidoreductase [Candidatus Lokiarchaeota archaeon]